MVDKKKSSKFITLSEAAALEKLPFDCQMNLQIPIKFVKFVPESEVLQVRTAFNYRDMPKKSVWIFINNIPKDVANELINKVVALEKTKKESNLTSEVCISVENVIKRTQIQSDIPFNLRTRFPKKLAKAPKIGFVNTVVQNFEKLGNKNPDQLSLFGDLDIRRD